MVVMDMFAEVEEVDLEIYEGVVVEVGGIVEVGDRSLESTTESMANCCTRN